jgi:hypothetical protein
MDFFWLELLASALQFSTKIIVLEGILKRTLPRLHLAFLYVRIPKKQNYIMVSAGGTIFGPFQSLVSHQ